MADVNVLDLTQATPGSDDSLILFDRNTGEAKSTRYDTLKTSVLTSKFGDSSPTAGQELSYDPATGKYKNTSQIASLKETLTQQINNNGSKNLCVNSCIGGAMLTQNNVTFTTGADGKITVNASTAASANTYYYLGGDTNEGANPKNCFTLKPGTYIFSGAPISGNSRLQLITSTGTVEKSLTASDPTYEFTVAQDSVYRVRVNLQSEKTASNEVLSPMICLKSDYDLDSSYEPYAKTNRQLTKETNYLVDNTEVNGAVNMLPNNATTQVINGVTFTVNDDGSITVNGTATASTTLAIGKLKVKSGITYRIDDGLNNLVYDEGLSVYTVSSPVQTDGSWYWRTDHDSSHDIRVRTANTDATVTVNIRVAEGFTVDNVTIKPMFCIGSYKGSYVSYAKSNKELTEDVATNATAIENVRRGTLAIPIINIPANTATEIISSGGIYLVVFTYYQDNKNGLYLVQVHSEAIQVHISPILEPTGVTLTFDTSVLSKVSCTSSGGIRCRVFKLSGSNY